MCIYIYTYIMIDTHDVDLTVAYHRLILIYRWPIIHAAAEVVQNYNNSKKIEETRRFWL